MITTICLIRYQLNRILKDIEHSITFKIKCERLEIQDVNVFNSIIEKNESRFEVLLLKIDI